MARIAYVNGKFERADIAGVNIEDRGFQFADGVYEVCLLVDGKWWDLEGHLSRLWRSLDALKIRHPMSQGSLCAMLAKLARLNRLQTGLVYLQVTRGAAPRNHPFPDQALPTLVVTARPFDFAASDKAARTGLSVITQSDIRWGRVDIKSISLLPNVLSKQSAREAGADEAMLVKGDKITEGASSNMWLIDDDGRLVTHPLGKEILGGITRETTLKCAMEMQLNVDERPFTLNEAISAKEVFLTSATNLIAPVVRINKDEISNGKPGDLTLKLRDAYIALNKATAKNM